jgi:hypothetical protein
VAAALGALDFRTYTLEALFTASYKVIFRALLLLFPFRGEYLIVPCVLRWAFEWH